MLIVTRHGSSKGEGSDQMIEVAAALIGSYTAHLLSRVQESEGELFLEIEDTEQALSSSLHRWDEWSRRVDFADLRRPKDMVDVYIELNVSLTLRRLRLKGDTAREAAASSAFKSGQNMVLLGDPGAGKTTSLKHFYLEARQETNERLPLVVVLRDLRESETLVDRIVSHFGVAVDSRKQRATTRRAINFATLKQLTNEVPLQILLDGLDEVRTEVRRSVLQDIRELADLPNSRVVLTCRSADYTTTLEGFQTYEIQPLEPAQIRAFVRRWLVSEPEVADFLVKLETSPFKDTAIRPLTLAHLCAVYERTGQVPEQPKTVYRKIVNLLLREWDEQKDVRRTSAYGGFEPDQKQDFLEHLSFYLTQRTSGTIFSHDILRTAYVAISEHFNLPKEEGELVAREIESHSGLVIQVGYEEYQFAHKSLQEYLSAEYIVKYPALPDDPTGTFAAMPNEYGIAVALSSAPSRFLARLLESAVMDIDEGRPSRELWRRHSIIPAAVVTFFTRLSLERPLLAYDVHLAAILGCLLSISFHDVQNHTSSAKAIRKAVVQLFTSAGRIAESSRDGLDLYDLTTRDQEVVFSLKSAAELSEGDSVALAKHEFPTRFAIPERFFRHLNVWDFLGVVEGHGA